jgi:hypothetical protein
MYRLVQKQGEGIIIGLSTDTKPSITSPSSLTFIETDTGRIYRYNGSSWVLQPTIVIPVGGIYTSSLNTDPARLQKAALQPRATRG